MKTLHKTLISDSQSLNGASYSSGVKIRTYDDGFGGLYVHRDSMGITGIVRAKSWHDAYSICEDELFPTADDAQEEMERIGAMPEGPDRDHEQACWDESYGFRPNGKGGPTPERDTGIYAKDLNADRLDCLSESLRQELGINLDISDNE